MSDNPLSSSGQIRILLEKVQQTSADQMKRTGMVQAGLTQEEVDRHTRRDDYHLSKTKKHIQKCYCWVHFGLITLGIAAILIVIGFYLYWTLQSQQETAHLLHNLLGMVGTSAGTLYVESLLKKKE